MTIHNSKKFCCSWISGIALLSFSIYFAFYIKASIRHDEKKASYQKQLEEAKNLVQQRKWKEALEQFQMVIAAIEMDPEFKVEILPEVKQAVAEVHKLSEEQRATTYHSLSEYILDEAESKIRQNQFSLAKKMLQEYLGRLLVANKERALSLLSGLEYIESPQKSTAFLLQSSDIDFRLFINNILPESYKLYDIPELQKEFINCLEKTAQDAQIARNATAYRAELAKQNSGKVKLEHETYNQWLNEKLDSPNVRLQYDQLFGSFLNMVENYSVTPQQIVEFRDVEALFSGAGFSAYKATYLQVLKQVYPFESFPNNTKYDRSDLVEKILEENKNATVKEIILIINSKLPLR